MNSRIQSVDLFRFIAIIAVIIIHTSPFKLVGTTDDGIYKYLFILLNQTSRFAVPFFFVISGYFWGVKIIKRENITQITIKTTKRLSIIFFIWSCIYLLPFNYIELYNKGLNNYFSLIYYRINYVINHPIQLITEGTAVHLWFLPALLCSLILNSIFVRYSLVKSLYCISIILYIFGVLAKSYINTPIGISSEINPQYGPFFGTIFFTTGYILSRLKSSDNWIKYGSILFIFGIITHFTEIYILWKFFNTFPTHGFVFGTYFMGTGFSVMALSNHPSLQIKKLSKIGTMTLGIYLIHIIYVDLFHEIDNHIHTPIWEISYVIIVTISSIISTLILYKYNITRKLIN